MTGKGARETVKVLNPIWGCHYVCVYKLLKSIKLIQSCTFHCISTLIKHQLVFTDVMNPNIFLTVYSVWSL